MARNSASRGSGRKTYAILVDGETEMWYLQMLRRHENVPGISIQPELPKRKTLKDQYEAVKSNAGIYDYSIWVLDLDVVLKLGATSELKRYLNDLKKIKKVHVLINTPCLEYWFLQHVKDTGAYYPECEPAGKELKKSNPLKDYEKSEKYFVRTPDIYLRLRPYLNTGISNALKRGKFDINYPEQGKAELHLLFEILGIKV